MNTAPVYPAKLLLYGEHITLRGGEALAVPLPRFGGRWAADAAGGPVTELLDWVGYLLEPGVRDQLHATLDLRAAADFFATGGHFPSDVPRGYGLGSSGALTAGLYHRFAAPRTVPTDVAQLQGDLAVLESFFHGKSSGTDPLIAYLNRGVHLRADQPPALVDLPTDLPADFRFFLVDTGQSRRTAPWVRRFLERYAAQSDFRAAADDYWRTDTRAAIRAALLGHWPEVHLRTQRIGIFQYKWLRDFCPAGLHPLWETLNTRPDSALKLCGAGGGGYLLGCTTAWSALQDALPETELVGVEWG